ncbi:molybdopterin-dependent oxidoreductase [Nocardia sp. NPDC058666]|uniref:molybdopterin-dependent oxidoreductase n=1 Tax=Nocardia sp. NPDC058666 TaxID=3346587 RepID=UPI00366984F8
MRVDLPPGQRPAPHEPFGLPQFGGVRALSGPGHRVSVGGKARHPAQFGIDDLFGAGERLTRTSDLHCVTQWSAVGLTWEGVRFADVYRWLAERVIPHPGARWVRFTGLDGYSSTMYLEDALAADVILADRLSDSELTNAFGAPLRLVAPAHYGYKSVKQVCAIDFLRSYDPGQARIVSHPRGRVDREERGRLLPGRLWRVAVTPGQIERVRALFRADL